VKLSLNLGYYQRIVQQKGIAVCEALKSLDDATEELHSNKRALQL
jgi:hypothetical protein